MGCAETSIRKLASPAEDTPPEHGSMAVQRCRANRTTQTFNRSRLHRSDTLTDGFCPRGFNSNPPRRTPTTPPQRQASSLSDRPSRLPLHFHTGWPHCCPCSPFPGMTAARVGAQTATNRALLGRKAYWLCSSTRKLWAAECLCLQWRCDRVAVLGCWRERRADTTTRECLDAPRGNDGWRCRFLGFSNGRLSASFISTVALPVGRG
jgi:hypothetical protein